MANIVIKPASGTLEFNTGVVAGSAVDTTLSGASRLTFDNGELNLVSYATGNLNRFTIDGSTSRLFSTYDQMSGSLMSINTIAGFPVFEAFSDNTIVLGKYGSKDFVSTGNKIGIGTAAPANKLEVFGTGDISVRITTTGSAAATDFAALRFFQGGVQKGSVIANSGVLRIGAGDGIGASSGVYVNSAGSVGIGITSPAAKLDIVHDSSASTPAIYVKGGVSGTPMGKFERIYGVTPGTTYVDISAHAGNPQLSITSATNTFAIGTNNSNSSFEIADNTTVGTNTRFLIDVNGNVGIGTTAPQTLLHVSGSAANAFIIERSGANTNINMQFKNTTASWYAGQTDGGAFGIGPTASLGSTSKFIIKSDGNVGIGTLSPTNNLQILGVGTEASPTTLSINTPGSSGSGDSRIILSQNTLNGDFQLLYAGTDTRSDGRTSNNAYIEQNQAINIRTKSNSTGFSSQILVGLAGTIPGIAFSTNATGSLAIERMRIDVSGNVGIGTTTPTQKLDLSGTLRISSAGTYSDPAVENAGFINYNTTDGILTLSARSHGGNTFTAFRTSNGGTGSEKMRITNDGNVGIGVTSPVAKLTVIPTGQAFDGTNAMVAYFGKNTLSGYGSTFIRVAKVQNTTGIAGNLEYTDIEHNSLGTGPFRYGTYGDTNIINGVARTDGIYGSINFVTSGSVKMTIAGGTGNGYVGIGTVSPTSKLTVVQSSGADSVLLELESNNDPSIRFGRSSYGSLIRHISDGTDYIAFNCNGTSKPSIAATAQVVFTENGNVGIGTTTPVHKLDVNGYVNIASANGLRWANGNIQITNATYDMLLQTYNGVSALTEKMRITSVGNVGIGTTTPSGKLEAYGTGDISVRITTLGNDATTDFAALRFFQGGVQKGSVIANSGVLRIGAGDGIGVASGVYVNSAGSVGIGISPAYPLQIRRSAGGGSLAISVNNVMSQYGRDSLYLAIADLTTDIAGHAWYVRNATATDNFAMGINNLGNVGIGTDRPTGKLEVLGAGDVSVRITTSGDNATTDFAALRFFQGGVQKGSVIANSGVLRIGAGDGIGATSGVYVTSVGNVGIGTSSPSQLLDITGAFTSWGGWVLGGSPGGPIGIGAGSSSATRYIGAGASTTNFYHNVPVGGTFRFNIAESEKVRIDTNGNVGIGTTTPSGKLEAYGTGDISVRITTSGNNATTDFAALRFFQGGAQKGSVIANNSVLRFSAGTNLSGIFISDSGNVGINSIPTGTNNVRFQVNGGVGSNVAALRFENCGLVLGGNLSDKAFSSWLPIQIDSSTTRYIPLYA